MASKSPILKMDLLVSTLIIRLSSLKKALD
jgi:hypothetical protein